MIYIDDTPEICYEEETKNNCDYTPNINKEDEHFEMIYGNYTIDDNNHVKYNKPDMSEDIPSEVNNPGSINTLINKIVTDKNYFIMKLKHDETGLEEQHLDFLDKLITKLKQNDRYILFVTDFDCTLTKVHLFHALNGNKLDENTDTPMPKSIKDITPSQKRINKYKEIMQSSNTDTEKQELINYFIKPNIKVYLERFKTIKK